MWGGAGLGQGMAKECMDVVVAVVLHLSLFVCVWVCIPSKVVYFTFVADLATCFAFKSCLLSICDHHHPIGHPDWHSCSYYCDQRMIHNAVVAMVSPCSDDVSCRQSWQHLDAIHADQRL